MSLRQVIRLGVQCASVVTVLQSPELGFGTMDILITMRFNEYFTPNLMYELFCLTHG